MLTKAEEKELRRRLRADSQIELVRLVEEAGIPAGLVSSATAAAVTGVTASFIRRAVNRGSIKAYRFSSRLLIPLDEVLQVVSKLPRHTNPARGPRPASVQGTRVRVYQPGEGSELFAPSISPAAKSPPAPPSHATDDRPPDTGKGAMGYRSTRR